MNDPSRADILLAIWSILALSDDEDEFLGTDAAQEVLGELFDDLHRDLSRAEPALDDDWAIAQGSF